MKFKVNHTFLVQLLFLSLAGITAWQKISGLAVPQWFQHKFENSFKTCQNGTLKPLVTSQLLGPRNQTSFLKGFPSRRDP